MNTFAEQSEAERREALRMARFEAFALRTMEAQRAAERAGQKVCNLRLKEPRKQLVLEFQI